MKRRGMGGHQKNPRFPSPDDEKAAERAALRRAFVSLLKVPKAPNPTEPNQAKPSHGVRLRPHQTHHPASSTTTTTPPSPRRLRPPFCGNGAVTNLSVLN